MSKRCFEGILRVLRECLEGFRGCYEGVSLLAVRIQMQFGLFCTETEANIFENSTFCTETEANIFKGILSKFYILVQRQYRIF